MNESFYRQLMDSLYEGVYFIDRNKGITFWNKGAERLTGYTREEALGRSCQDNFLSHVDNTGNSLCASG
jgi:PAS domain S-box-containing protein